jgi:predicted permease
VLLTLIGLRLYAHFGPGDLIPGLQPAVNGSVMVFLLLVSVAASAIFGLAPAVETSSVSVNDALKERSRGSTGGIRILGESIVAFEIAVSLILLIAAGLLVRSLVKLEHTSPGFQSENVLLAIVPLPVADYPLPAQRIAFERTLLDRVRSLPGIVSAAASDFPPFAGGAGSHIEIAGQQQNSAKSTQVVYQTFSSSAYLETLRIPLLKGRRLNSRDDLSSLPVCDIDETVAKRFFRNSEPIGMQMLLPVPKITCTIIGIVGATKSRSLSRTPLPRIYYSSLIPVSQITLVIKVVRDPLALVSALRHEVLALNSNLPLSSMTLEQFLADSLARQRFSIQLTAIFAAVAVLLAAIGIYGVLAFSVDRRRREFGIRMALGARAGDVIGLVLLQGSLPVGIGLTCGIAGAFGMTRYLRSLLYEISTTDPMVFSSIVIGLIVVSLLATSLPVHRATRLDPLETLREE